MTYYDLMKRKYENLKNKENVNILAFETSCDETSVSVVKNGREVLSCIIATQIPIHERFGGVVPEVASRNHIMAISSVTEKCLAEAKLEFKDIDAIAVTYGAGLVGALLVGVNFAKALAFANSLPLIAVSHIYGHIASNYISNLDLEPPFICLLASGGHTAILQIDKYSSHKLLGTTVDDAVGEAFDKVARVLNLPYPGGPKIDKLAKEGKANIVFLKKGIMKDSVDFSFSGLKTAVINYIHNHEQKSEEFSVQDVCASFQREVFDDLVKKAVEICNRSGIKKLAVAGGVAANSYLKQLLTDELPKNGISLYMPKLVYCTDNAAMIGSAAYYLLKEGKGLADLSLTASAVVSL